MSRIAVVGSADQVGAWGLAGALVIPVDDRDDPGGLWERIPADVEVVVASAEIAAAAGAGAGDRLVVVLP